VVSVGSTLKYLVLVLDLRWTFRDHFRLFPKAWKMVITIGRLTTNIGGLGQDRRRVYTSVVMSVILYGAPITVAANCGLSSWQITLRRAYLRGREIIRRDGSILPRNWDLIREVEFRRFVKRWRVYLFSPPPKVPDAAVREALITLTIGGLYTRGPTA